MTSEPNMRKLKRSRVAPKVGDVFTYLMPDGMYRFGRVIATSVNWWTDDSSAILIYLFRGTTSAPSMPDPSMVRSHALLVPPAMTNRLGWSRGYFETIGNIPLGPEDVLQRHCFHDLDGGQFDETGRKLYRWQHSDTCGFRGLHSYRSLDDQLSRTLGIPIAPD